MYKLFLLLLVFCVLNTSGLKLKQVVILSRHSVRTPLSTTLTNITPYPWPTWAAKSGELTAKGAILEGFMGEYFSQWLKKEGLIQDGCPKEDSFYAYANNKQRTIASARAFSLKAFPSCKITVHHANQDKLDENFNPVIHNDTKSFKDVVRGHMEERLREIKLDSSLSDLENILDYKESDDCILKKHCDLVHDKTVVKDIVVGQEPAVSGSLHIGNAAVDSFKMAYYEGFPLINVAWGQINDSSKWDRLMAINVGYHNVRFNTTISAKDIAGPLIMYIREKFSNEKPNVTLLTGHDANLLTVLCALNFKPYQLKNQHETTPIGGKVVFQKWWDDVVNRNLLKMEYVYQTSKQLRDAIPLNLNNPPESLLMELQDCPVDERGFCLWDDFMKILGSF